MPHGELSVGDSSEMSESMRRVEHIQRGHSTKADGNVQESQSEGRHIQGCQNENQNRGLKHRICLKGLIAALEQYLGASLHLESLLINYYGLSSFNALSH